MKVDSDLYCQTLKEKQKDHKSSPYNLCPIYKSSEVTIALNELKTEKHIENITVCHSSHIEFIYAYLHIQIWSFKV